MADVTPRELASAREAAGLYQYQVASLLGVSEYTVGRWERGEVVPTTDEVDKLERLYKAPGLWYGHMRYQYKSFRDRYPEEESGAALAMSMVQAMYQMADVARHRKTPSATHWTAKSTTSGASRPTSRKPRNCTRRWAGCWRRRKGKEDNNGHEHPRAA